MKLTDKAKGRQWSKTSNPENWRKVVSITLSAEEIALADRLCKKYGVKRSELFRQLLYNAK